MLICNLKREWLDRCKQHDAMTSRFSPWEFTNRFEMLCVDAFYQIEVYRLATARKEPEIPEHREKLREAFGTLLDCTVGTRDWQAMAIQRSIRDLIHKQYFSQRQLAEVHAELQRVVLNYLE